MNPTFNRFKLLQSTISDLHASLCKRDVTVTDICKQSLRRLEETKQLNSFITVCDKDALESAHHCDSLIQDGSLNWEKNKLFGSPVSVKDNFCTRGTLTTCGSRMLHNFVPPYDATVVSKLKNAKCLIMGKTNMDEYAMGSSSLTSYYGPTANCWHADVLNNEKPDLISNKAWYMAGGSSTGSAVSVASGACFASLGTDTGGSTRQPASFTGLVGFKPTYGLVSRYGLIPLAHCLDVVSILARCCEDTRLVFDTIVGIDENDLTTVDHRTHLKQKLSRPRDNEKLKIRIGVPESFVEKGNVSADVSNLFDQIVKELADERMSNVSCEISRVDLPNSQLSTECYTVISSAEIASNMSCYDGLKYGFSVVDNGGTDFDRDEFFRANRDAGFGPEVKKRILLGNYFLSRDNRDKYLMQSLKVRRLISEEFDLAFKSANLDIILTPSTPTASVSYEEWIRKQDDNKLFHQDYFLIPTNLANRPSISIPCGLSRDGTPIGLQLIGDKFEDLDLLFIAKLVQDYLSNR